MRTSSLAGVSTPTTTDVRRLPAFRDQTVPPDFMDENGHMNIGHYFRLGSHAVWDLFKQLGMGEDYIAARGLSFFTVEHRLGYLGELRQGQRFSIRAGLVGRTGKAVHAAAYVLDEDNDRVACAVETIHVHVSMESRRATEIPEDLRTTFDADIAEHAAWLGPVADGLTLRR